MDHEKYDKLQRDQQIGNTPDALLAAAVENRLKDVHTALPGVVQSFDPERQTAQVQPAIKRIYTTAGPVDLPMCLDVPVHFPHGGDFYITWPVTEGDECLLIFSERCIDRWFVQGNTQEPDEYRMHDMSDGFALVGFNSLPKVIEDFQTDGIDIRNKDRSAFAKVADDLIEMNLNDGETLIEMTPGLIRIVGDIEHTGNITSSGTHTAAEHTAGGVNLTTHVHLIIVPVSGTPVTPPMPT